MRNCEGKLSGWARGCPRCPHRCFCHPLPPAWVLGRQRSKAVNIKFKKARKKGGKKTNQNKKNTTKPHGFPRGGRRDPERGLAPGERWRWSRGAGSWGPHLVPEDVGTWAGCSGGVLGRWALQGGG